MMTTFRVAMPTSSSLDAMWPPSDARASAVQHATQVGEVAQLYIRSWQAGRQRRRFRIDPGRAHADLMGAEHVDVGAVADEERLLGRHPNAPQRLFENGRRRLSPPDLVRHQ